MKQMLDDIRQTLKNNNLSTKLAWIVVTGLLLSWTIISVTLFVSMF